MCDTMVVVPPSGPVWFAKNSDREPGEAQVVEHHPAGPAIERRATWVPIPEPAPRAAVVLSRPAWMWGAEMGVNEYGVAIGNEAVFTRLPVARVGLTGMDLLRLALEQARTADDALELLAGLLARHGQGGRCGFRSAGFRYHNAFVIADRRGAWLLETADRCWAAVRVRGVRTTSNVLTIDAPDRIGPGTLEEARRRGFYRDDRPFSFREAFGRTDMAFLSGGDVRRACSLRTLSARDGGEGTDLARCMAALRDHGGHDPQRGLRMTAPCAHARAPADPHLRPDDRLADRAPRRAHRDLGHGHERAVPLGVQAPLLRHRHRAGPGRRKGRSREPVLAQRAPAPRGDGPRPRGGARDLRGRSRRARGRFARGRVGAAPRRGRPLGPRGPRDARAARASRGGSGRANRRRTGSDDGRDSL
ncbi:MAG: C69 family dipeptidase [Myxococcales bacterium]|nr:C69 family dipeptidase [Myxococcales bacterium]